MKYRCTIKWASHSYSQRHDETKIKETKRYIPKIYLLLFFCTGKKGHEELSVVTGAGPRRSLLLTINTQHYDYYRWVLSFCKDNVMNASKLFFVRKT